LRCTRVATNRIDRTGGVNARILGLTLGGGKVASNQNGTEIFGNELGAVEAWLLVNEFGG